MFKKFSMANYKPIPTLFLDGVVLCREDGVELVEELDYKSIFGSLKS